MPLIVILIGEGGLSDIEVWDDSDNSDDDAVREHCSEPKLPQEKCVSPENRSVTILVHWIIGFILNFHT